MRKRRGRPPNLRATDPKVRRLAQAMIAEGMTLRDMEARAGVSKNTVQAWFANQRSPGVGLLDACLEVVGLRLAVVEREEA